MILKTLVRSKLGNTVHCLEHILNVLKLAVKAVLKKAPTLSITLINDFNILYSDQDRTLRSTGNQVCCCTSANQY